MAVDLVCSRCGREYAAGPAEPWRCSCGGPLEFATSMEPDGKPNTFDRDAGLWAFEDLLPGSRRVTLGEGFTPIVDAPRWDATFKLEYVFPSGSFKDRGATTTLSRAVELGVDRIVEDSSGNAGAAIALYAARAGIPADIYVPADVKPAKRAAIERTGATAVAVPGSRQDVTDACLDAVDAGSAWYASHAWNPAFFAGTATVAFEVAVQRDFSVPDAVVVPLGHGTLFLGAYRGFQALEAAGWIDEVPRLLGVQASGVAPIAEVIHGKDTSSSEGREFEDGKGPGPEDGKGPGPEDGKGPGSGTAKNDIADGIQIAEPARRDQILAAIEDTDGDAIAVGPDKTQAALEALHRSGFYVEPTSAVAVAGLERYRERGLSRDADVLVPLTGSGLKM